MLLLFFNNALVSICVQQLPDCISTAAGNLFPAVFRARQCALRGFDRCDGVIIGPPHARAISVITV